MDPKLQDNAPSVGRRRALQVGAATAVGAVTWAQPSLKGFARTPAYASEGSGIAEFGLLIFDPVGPQLPQLASDGSTYILATGTPSATTLTVEVTAVDSGGGPLTGCNCVLTSAAYLCGPGIVGTISGTTAEFDVSSCVPDPSAALIISGSCS